MTQAIQSGPKLQPGESHVTVIDVQNFLRRFGYLSPDAVVTSGRMDAQTVQALTRFQERFKVETPGVLDPRYPVGHVAISVRHARLEWSIRLQHDRCLESA